MPPSPYSSPASTSAHASAFNQCHLLSDEHYYHWDFCGFPSFCSTQSHSSSIVWGDNTSDGFACDTAAPMGATVLQRVFLLTGPFEVIAPGHPGTVHWVPSGVLQQHLGKSTPPPQIAGPSVLTVLKSQMNLYAFVP